MPLANSYKNFTIKKSESLTLPTCVWATSQRMDATARGVGERWVERRSDAAHNAAMQMRDRSADQSSMTLQTHPAQCYPTPLLCLRLKRSGSAVSLCDEPKVLLKLTP